jgi:hypothetical protein
VVAKAPSLRHRWHRLRKHVRICRKCGCGRVTENADGAWQYTYHQPNGVSLVLRHVPPCVEGPLTVSYLAKYDEQLRQPEWQPEKGGDDGEAG